jgi:2-haloacid dehalogenase
VYGENFVENHKKTIVFDLGGVLIDWDPRYLYSQIFTDQDEMEFFLRAVCSPEWNAQMDGEKSFQDGIEELIPLHPEYADQIQAYFTRWEEMIRGVFSSTVQILSELKEAGYPLAALSNWSSETFPILNAKYEFLDWFDPLMISGHVGLVKPDPQIFNLLLCSLDRDSNDCIYIDDMKPNIKAASEIGFSFIHYTGSDQLRRELIEQGIHLS